ncbi:MAG: hypothetical protein ACE5GD_01760 [Candidatus Geothermarchaeales archaeon]
MKGLIIHIGEYFKPSIIDVKRPYEYEIRYAKFDEDGKATPKGDLHIDPEFEMFTYGDHPWKGAKANLGRLKVGDYIFFNCTFLEKPSGEKTCYIVGYFKLKEIMTAEEILRKHVENKKPYCNNEHVKYAIEHGTEAGTIFIGDPEESKRLRIPLKQDRELVKRLDLKDRHGNSVADQFDRKKDKFGRLMSEIEIINIYTRNPKIFNEKQVEILLEEIRKLKA